MLRPSLRSLFAPLFVLAVALTAAPAAAQGPSLRDRANRAIHALRAEQRPDGSYGGTVTTTATTLFGFARSPRQYREADGPLVSSAVDFLLANRKADGTIATAADADPIDATLLAALAFEALDAKKHAGVIGAALEAVAKTRNTVAPKSGSAAEMLAGAAPKLLPVPPADDADAQTLLNDGLKPNGGYGDAAKTASRLVLINRLSSMQPPPKPSGAPARPVALPNYDPNAAVDLDEVTRKAIRALLQRQMKETGGFGSAITKGQDLGVTALAAHALWSWPGEMPKDVRDAAERAIAIVAAAAKPDGSIFGMGLENYTTSAAVGALVASGNPKYREIIAKGRAYLEDIQANEKRGFTASHPFYGGSGYGNEERPDLSNTQYALDAIVAAGAKASDPALQRALQFLQACQNRSESNHFEISRDGVLAVSGNDGGGVYYPGNSKAGNEKLADGREVPRSYGSMTYALLKGFVFAGLPKDDPRLKDALAWCQKRYTLDYVPGYEEMAKVEPTLPYQGLFYYYLTMATALRAYGADVMETPDGKKHEWRREMAARIASLQKPDGSFVNENSQRWFEADDVIATSYVVLTLSALRK